MIPSFKISFVLDQKFLCFPVFVQQMVTYSIFHFPLSKKLENIEKIIGFIPPLSTPLCCNQHFSILTQCQWVSLPTYLPPSTQPHLSTTRWPPTISHYNHQLSTTSYHLAHPLSNQSQLPTTNLQPQQQPITCHHQLLPITHCLHLCHHHHPPLRPPSLSFPQLSSLIGIFSATKCQKIIFSSNNQTKKINHFLQ